MKPQRLTQKRKNKQKQACPSGKVPYETREGAIFYARADRAIFGHWYRAYECQDCQKWHLATKRLPRPQGEGNE